MRRADREIKENSDIIAIIDTCMVVKLAMVDENSPYIVPMNFGYTWENEKLTFYLHSAKEGRKLDILAKNNRVCFEMDSEHRLIEGNLPCQYSYEFASVIGEGRAEIVDSVEEKISAMKVLMKHVSKKDFEFNDKLVSALTVIKLPIDSFTGKRRRMPNL